MNLMGQRIKELRIKKGISQERLAEALNVNRANISNYERGTITNIPSDKLLIMADLFNTSIDYITGRTNEPTDYEIQTIAAHHDGEDWTEEELQDIEEFKELVKLKRQLRKNKG